MSWSSAALALALFPTGDFHELALGSYSHQLSPALATGIGATTLGLDLRYRRVFDTDNPDVTPTGETARLRLYRDADGQTHIDQLEVETLLGSFRIRPELGDTLDIGLLFGTWDEIWVHSDSGRAQWRVHTPITLTGLGLANNDMDPDDRIKWYGAVGLGVGGDWVRRVRGPVGLQARAETGLQSRVRWNPGDPATTRHEWATNAEAGVTWLRDQQSLALTGWVESVTQWDPRDPEGRDGVDRHYLGAGLALSGRLYQGRSASAEPDLASLAGELEAVAALAELEAAAAAPDPDGEHAELLALLQSGPAATAPAETPEPPPGVLVIAEDDPEPGVLTVHWSELAVAVRTAAVAVAPLPAAPCLLRIVLDPEGVPTAVGPASCPEALVETATNAARLWRFEPFLDGDRAIPVQVVFPIVFESPP